MTRSLDIRAIGRAARRARPASVLAALALLAGLGVSMQRPSAEEARVLPAPTLDETATPQTTSEVAVLAGGCFWGVQGVFQHVKGVVNAESGYTGGEAATAHYERVGQNDTGHAESVAITFDPRQISYGRLLQIFFSVVHDPTELNHQGPDYGSQYRSAIFPANAEQARVAAAYIAQLSQTKIFAGPIVTRIESGKTFYPAEAYHQNFLTDHPTYPYIVYNDLPKVESLKRLFPQLYRSEPALVSLSSN